jgi:hypothetical protein
LRLAGCTGHATEGHHVIDWRDGGARYDLDNVVAACKSCNVAEANRRRATALRRQREARPHTPLPPREW